MGRFRVDWDTKPVELQRVAYSDVSRYGMNDIALDQPFLDCGEIEPGDRRVYEGHTGSCGNAGRKTRNTTRRLPK